MEKDLQAWVTFLFSATLRISGAKLSFGGNFSALLGGAHETSLLATI